MKTKKTINIFIENTYEDFSEISSLDCSKYTKDSISMLEYFLENKKWIKNSCIAELSQQYKTICLDIVFVNDEKIHEINRDYREKDRPTDVISFAIFADSPEDERFIFDEEINLGEIIISLDTTKKQAEENHKTFDEELYFLIAHGLLHLLGYDHLTEETLEEMWNIQTEMIEGIKNIGSQN